MQRIISVDVGLRNLAICVLARETGAAAVTAATPCSRWVAHFDAAAKKDDYADSLLQAVAWCRLNPLPRPTRLHVLAWHNVDMTALPAPPVPTAVPAPAGKKKNKATKPRSAAAAVRGMTPVKMATHLHAWMRHLELGAADVVVVEAQMKSVFKILGGMILQYFVCAAGAARAPAPHLEQFAAKHKLADCALPKLTYAQRKRSGVLRCRELLLSDMFGQVEPPAPPPKAPKAPRKRKVPAAPATPAAPKPKRARVTK
jgi:hypothetical protein